MATSTAKTRVSARWWLAAVASFMAWLAVAPPTASASPPSVLAYDSLATIRSDQPLPPGGSPSASISAAGNEFESFQVTVQAGSSGLGGVRVDPGKTLTSATGATIPNSALTIYREGDYQVQTRSSTEGATGPWPDALIPERDPIYNENRNAFPFDLAANSRLTVWIDVLVPKGTAAGEYDGSVLVSGDGGTVSEVPVHLTVHGFSIPSTTTLRSAFGGSGGSGIDQTLFELEALDNRVTLSNISPSRLSSFLPLLEGTDPRLRLPGAQMTAIDTYGCSASCVGQWRGLAQQHPEIADRFVDYVCDEPHSSADWSNCDSNAAAADSAWPGVRKLVTSGVSNAPNWVTDASPLVDHMQREGVSVSRNWQAGDGSRRLWSYTSCDSYDCGGAANEPSWTGWPGYAIDAPASQARAMGWLSYVSGARGELYWSTTHSLSSAWTNQYDYGDNGDGNLFYPGTTDIVGGTHPIPIESIRLKRIRDGREDYEYLHILSEQGRSDDAMAIAEQLFPAMNKTTVSPQAVNSARSSLASLIESSGTPRHTLTVSVASGGGTVTGPGIACPGDCSATFSDGIALTLNAHPSSGGKIAGWGGDCTGAGNCQLAMDSDKTVSVSFDGPPASTRDQEPETKIVAGPSGKTRNLRPIYRFISSEPHSTFQCRRDQMRWRWCSSPGGLGRLSYGRHTLFVRARDATGNWDHTPARRSLRVLRGLR